jgi:hypothetical protein
MNDLKRREEKRREEACSGVRGREPEAARLK